MLCEVCGAVGFEHLLLRCSDCKGGHTHQYCLDKVLFDASLEDWFCEECNQKQIVENFLKMLPILEKDRVAMAEKAAQNDALKAKVDALLGQLDVKKSLALLIERMASADAKHNNMKTQCASLKSQLEEIPVLRSKIVLEQEKNALQVEHSTQNTQCQALQSQVEEIPQLKSQVKALGEVGTALRGEKAGLEAELKSAISEQEKGQFEVKYLRECIRILEEKEAAWLGAEERHKAAPRLKSQVKALGEVGTALRGEKAGLEAEWKSAISEQEKGQFEVKYLRECIRILEEEEAAWLGAEERHKAAITAFQVERDKMIRDKSAQDSEIETFHAELKKLKSEVESYKSHLTAARLEKKAAVHNEGSYSRSLGNASSERPSNHAQFETISQQPITTGINCAAPAPLQSPSTGITQELGGTGRKGLAPIRCQDFHSACSLEAETGALPVCLHSHVQSKVTIHNQLAPEHVPATFVSPPLAQITDTVGAAPIRTVEFLGSDGGQRHTSHEQGRRMREGSDRVSQSVDGHRDTRTSVGSSETNKELTFEQVSRHFSMPIKQAALEMNTGLATLKKQCRKLGITYWPHRKVKSVQTLIDNVQGLGKENAQENGHLTRSLVGFMQQTMKLFGERRPDVDQRTEELRQVCFNENNAQENRHLTRSVVEFLQLTKKMIEERPDMNLDQRTKHLRQVYFKESFKRKRS